MRRLKHILHALIVCVALTGCQNTGGKIETDSISAAPENAASSENKKNPQDGDRLTLSLAEGIRLDAVIEMPDIDFDAVPFYHVATRRYDGEKLITLLLGAMPENVKVTDHGAAGKGYRYQGNLGEKWQNVDGLVYADDVAYIETAHWDEISGYFPVVYAGDEIQVVTGSAPQEEEFSFKGLKKASEEIVQYLKETAEFEDARMYQAFAFSWKQMRERQENMLNTPVNEQAKPEEKLMRDWKEEDNCYWMLFEQTLSGIPVLSHNVSRQDDLYIPASSTEAGYTQNGIEYIKFGISYEILDAETVKLADIGEVCEALQKKFEIVLVADITIDQMKLIYYPLPTKQNKDGQWLCDLLPAWQLRVWGEGFMEYLYIDAVNSIEIVG